MIKADGLALGKGVSICMTREEAVQAVKAAMIDGVFGKSGSRIVAEEYLEGPEVSCCPLPMAMCCQVPWYLSMDHKRTETGTKG